jgi:uncharacterized phage infection (PIP) family protein YhgE
MAKKAASKKKKTKKKRARTKRKVKKTASKKGKTTKVKYHSTKEIRVEKALIDNFIGLQKVMVNLSSKFDNLANQMSKLLELFEISAKALATKDFGIEKEGKESKKMIEKLDNISQQAGLIGKGLALIHEAGQDLSPQLERKVPPTKIRRTPQVPRSPPGRIQEGEGFQRSINPRLKREKRVTEENAETNF